jgi:streptomycin 6-kinase
VTVPTPFAEEVARREGAAGRAWLASLPALIRHCCRDRNLTLDGTARHGFAGLVLPVTRADDTPAVLKLSRLDADTRDEPVALSTWDGAGAVLLRENAPSIGAMLLERLDSGRTLLTEPLVEATGFAAQLLRRLAVPAPGTIRDLRTESERLTDALPRSWARLGKPLPRPLLDAAVSRCRELGPDAAASLVNQDLHGVLRGPAPIRSSPRRSCVALAACASRGW